MPHPIASPRRTIGRSVGPARFIGFIMIMLLGWLAYSQWVKPTSWHESIAMGFDLGATFFLVTLVPNWREKNSDSIRRHASENEANRVLVLIVTALIAIAVMAAIAGELPAARQGSPVAVIKLVGTLLLTWLFTNCVYALHYAHEFYRACPGFDGDARGLDFPHTPEPSYGDFAYFAFTLGMTFQTSDVAITAAKMRHIVLLHSFVAFLFNMGIIAFTINALGGIGSSGN